MKKIISVLLCILIMNIVMVPMIAFAEEDSNSSQIEHLQLPKKLAKKTPTDIVNSTDKEIEILPYNTLQIAFAEDFNSKYAKVGDEVVFILPDCLTTQEGTVVLPASTKLVAEICNVEKPKAFNRSGKVYLDFKYIELPDGTPKYIDAKYLTVKISYHEGN